MNFLEYIFVANSTLSALLCILQMCLHFVVIEKHHLGGSIRICSTFVFCIYSVGFIDRLVVWLMLQPKQLSPVYYICKELLMTERTYKKDLDIINIVSSLVIQLLHSNVY